MWRFRRKNGGDTALAERFAADHPGPTSELSGRDRATSRGQPRASRDRRERPARAAAAPPGRHPRARRGARRAPTSPRPTPTRLPDGRRRCPRSTRADVTPGLLRAGILRDGCVLVRGLIARDAALALRRADRPRRSPSATASRDGERAPRATTRSSAPHALQGASSRRAWIKEGGGVLAADSPTAGVRDARAVPGRPACPSWSPATSASRPLISVHKTTLRKADARPSPGAWHQDGAFMGEVRSLNLWLSLSRCGDVAPGLDIVPRRLDELVRPQTDEAVLDTRSRSARPRRRAGDTPIIRPIFEPGDALFFDEMFLHQTGWTRRCRTPASRSRTGSSGAPPSRSSTRRSHSGDGRPVLARPRALGCVAGAVGRADAAVPGRRRRSLGGGGRRVRRRSHARARRAGEPDLFLPASSFVLLAQR